MNRGIFLLLGSNLGDKTSHLKNAVSRIEETIGPVVRKSAIYQTAAWGKGDQPAFYNQVIEIKTSLFPDQVLQEALSIELKMGRVRIEKWAQRIIDIDILFYNNAVVKKPDLSIPHPGIPERRFTLVPLCELAPEFIHPELHKTIHQLLDACTDTLAVEKIG